MNTATTAQTAKDNPQNLPKAGTKRNVIDLVTSSPLVTVSCGDLKPGLSVGTTSTSSTAMIAKRDDKNDVTPVTSNPNTKPKLNHTSTPNNPAGTTSSIESKTIIEKENISIKTKKRIENTSPQLTTSANVTLASGAPAAPPTTITPLPPPPPTTTTTGPNKTINPGTATTTTTTTTTAAAAAAAPTIGTGSTGKSRENLDEKKLRRLEKNRLSARQCRRRKKLETQKLEHEIKRMEGENLRLRLQLKLGREAEESAQQEQDRVTEILETQLKGGASESDIYATLEEFKEKFADYGRERRSAIEFHFRNFERLLKPSSSTSTVITALRGGSSDIQSKNTPPDNTTKAPAPIPSHNSKNTKDSKSKLDKVKSSSSNSSIDGNTTDTNDNNEKSKPLSPKALFVKLSEHLEVTPQQATALKDSRWVAKELDATLAQSLQMLEELRQKFTQCGVDLEHEFAAVRSILTPTQTAKFLIWVANNGACMHMLNELWSKIYSNPTPPTSSNTTIYSKQSTDSLGKQTSHTASPLLARNVAPNAQTVGSGVTIIKPTSTSVPGGPVLKQPPPQQQNIPSILPRPTAVRSTLTPPPTRPMAPTAPLPPNSVTSIPLNTIKNPNMTHPVVISKPVGSSIPPKTNVVESISIQPTSSSSNIIPPPIPPTYPTAKLVPPTLSTIPPPIPHPPPPIEPPRIEIASTSSSIPTSNEEPKITPSPAPPPPPLVYSQPH